MQTLYKEKRNSEENKVITKVTNNPKAFSKYVNKYRKYTSKLGPLKAWSKYEDDPKTMTKILTDQYKSVFTTPKDIPVVSLKPAKNGNSLSEITILDKDIKEAIDEIAIASAPGPDGITARICKEYADQLIPHEKNMASFLRNWKITRNYCSSIYSTNL